MNQYEKEQQIVEWLKDYEAYKYGIENLKELIEDIADEGMGIDYSRDKISPTNKYNSDTENKAIRMDKLDIQKRIKSMTNVVNSVNKAMGSLTEIERLIIKYRCIENKFYYQFCYKLSLGERTARRKKKDALKKMAIVIFGEE
jgi:hypothetical protein